MVYCQILHKLVLILTVFFDNRKLNVSFWLLIFMKNKVVSQFHKTCMSKKIKTEFHQLSSFLNFKEEVWQVCKQLYTLEEAVYYERLSIFKHFVIFRDEDKAIGFLSFFFDELTLNTKTTVLIGIGHGGVLPEYRNQQLIPRATSKFALKTILQNPFKKYFIWGMATTHLSYRMGLRGVKVQYPALDGNCPTLCKELLDWVGNKYYKENYSSSSFTAKISFAAIGQSIIPSGREIEDPIVANFIERVPSALAPNNKIGAFSITPIGPNLIFWIKKFIWGKRQKQT